MSKYRLTDKHKAVKAFNELCELADKLDIKIRFYGVRTILEYNGKSYDLEDVEGFEHIVDAFPPDTECMMTYETEEE